MNRTFKTILAVVMAVAMMASLCVTAMAEYPASFRYTAGPNKPNDIWIEDGEVIVKLKEAQDWPDDLSLVDTYAIAENVAYTLFLNGQNYQPVIDCQDIYHFVVFSPICFAVPLCWVDGVDANIAEFTIVAIPWPDGSYVDYEITDPYGNPVTSGQALINDYIGHVVLPESLLAALPDGVYDFVIKAKTPGEGDGTGDGGKDYTSHSPFGIQDGKLVSALDEDLTGGKGKSSREINYYNEDWGKTDPKPVTPVTPKKVQRDIGHGFTISDGKLGLGAHYQPRTGEVTITAGTTDFTFPTDKSFFLGGGWDVSPSGDHNWGLNIDWPKSFWKK